MAAQSEKQMVFRCANHPDTETYLRCSRCGKPICVKCTIQTPVGGRCRECAALQRPIMFQVSPLLYIRAVALGLAVGVGGGFLLATLGGPMRFFSWILICLLGYAVGEAVSRGARGRISRGLKIAAGALTVVGVVLGNTLTILSRLPANLPLGPRVEAALGFALSSSFDRLDGLLILGMAVVIATSRIR